MISLVAFLGNYGTQYKNTRHNVAWLFEDSLSFLQFSDWKKKFQGYNTSDDTLAQRRVYFLKPETYMNLSGDSIGQLTRFYKIPPEEVLVVHDELE